MNSGTYVSDPTSIASKNIQETPVPALGFGTYELTGDTCRRCVAEAIENGYRHVDTARMYENESEVGEGLSAARIDREQLFLTSKIWFDRLEPKAIEEEIETSLRLLKTDYLDLTLIHWPNPDIPLEKSIEALEEQRKKGRTRHIGVSNFPPSWFKRAIACGPIFCNQVEYHVMLNQDPILEIARAHDILLTAYAPLAQGAIQGESDLEKIAKKHNKTVHQVALRWLLQQDQVAAIPRSSKPEHIASNFKVFDFELEPEDLDLIGKLPKDRRQIDPDFAPDWEQ